jgi:hypothetical protein
MIVKCRYIKVCSGASQICMFEFNRKKPKYESRYNVNDVYDLEISANKIRECPYRKGYSKKASHTEIT